MATESTATGRLDVPPVHFAPVRGARIAYQDFGEGPAIVNIPPFAQNIEVAWEWPAVRDMFERFASFSRWIVFDKRGTGASDRQIPIANLDERVEDLRAVMDHAEVERAFLFGASEGGPMCLLLRCHLPRPGGRGHCPRLRRLHRATGRGRSRDKSRVSRPLRVSDRDLGYSPVADGRGVLPPR